MATTGAVDATEISLRALAAELRCLPEMAEAWEQEPEDRRLTYSLEWDEPLGRLEQLDRAYRSGALPTEQAARYRDLLRALREALPLIQKLALEPPRVSLRP